MTHIAVNGTSYSNQDRPPAKTCALLMFRPDMPSAPPVWEEAAPGLCTTTMSDKLTPKLERKGKGDSASHEVDYSLEKYDGNSCRQVTKRRHAIHWIGQCQ